MNIKEAVKPIGLATAAHLFGNEVSRSYDLEIFFQEGVTTRPAVKIFAFTRNISFTDSVATTATKTAKKTLQTQLHPQSPMFDHIPFCVTSPTSTISAYITTTAATV